MTFFVRAILTVCLLLQSIPGLVMQRCVAMPIASELVSAGRAADAGCACCGTEDGGAAIECPMAASGYAGCNCRNPGPDQPTPPPTDTKNLRFEQWLASPSILIAVLMPEPAQVPKGWAPGNGASRRSHSSIQSLLCVWRL